MVFELWILIGAIVLILGAIGFVVWWLRNG